MQLKADEINDVYFLLDAFKYGVFHRTEEIALGLDRLMMILINSE